MKIKSIKVKNLKAISDAELQLNGCNAIITAGNGKGKSTLLKSLIERIRGAKPEIIVKEGEKDGFYEMELTDGSRIVWKFTEKSESLTYITAENLKVTNGVIKILQSKYLGESFDIDIFLNSAPKKQKEILSKIIGIDFSKLDNDYKIAYDFRTDAKKELQNLIASKKTEPVKVEKPEIEKLKVKRDEVRNSNILQLAEIREKNNKIRNEWDLQNEKLREQISIWNEKVETQISKNKEIEQEKLLLSKINYLSFAIDFEAVKKYDCVKIAEKKIFEKNPQPEYLDENIDLSELQIIEKQIENATELMINFINYERDLKEYNEWIEKGKKARQNVDNAEIKVKEIETEKTKLIQSANMPEGFEFTDEGINYNGFPLSKEQQCTSALYIASLKLATLNLGELKTVYFDASTLDRKSLQEVEKFANEKGLQLLIEKPDFEGGEISYQIINEEN